MKNSNLFEWGSWKSRRRHGQNCICRPSCNCLCKC